MRDQGLLLRRILRALGIGALSAGQGACSALSEPGEPGDGPLPSATGGAVSPQPTEPLASFDNPQVGGGQPVSGRRGDAGTSVPHRTGPCPAEVFVAGLQNAWARTPPCAVESFLIEAICVTAADPDGDAGASDCEAARPDDECLLRLYSCGLQHHGDRVACGPVTVGPGVCCYVVEGNCPVGRPFLVGGVARLARLTPGAQWCAPSSPSLDGLSAELRSALADAWRQDGLFEHASVASFSRFALQLLAQGAPSELVDGALRAARDEVQHARLCLGLAAAYDGAAQSPTELRTDDALAAGTSAMTVAVSLAAEACVAETVSAQLIAAARDRALDRSVREALGTIARDEAEHVELAWKALAWLLRRGDRALHCAVAEVFARAHAHVGLGARVAYDVPEEALADHGYLSIPVRRQIAQHTLETVVLPAARLLMADTACPTAAERPTARA